jgi:hypothetical protein
MNKILSANKNYWSKSANIASFFWSAILLGASLVISIFANQYATLNGKTAVTDVVLSNVRVFDVDVFVIYGPLFLLIVVLLLLLFRPRTAAFTLKAIALFIIIRSVFICVTHLGQFFPQEPLDVTGFLYYIGGGNTGGLFFSGHTGVPFLLAMIFWRDKILRYFFIATSIFLGTCMLLGHLHYSIDVLGAFFITPTIYRLALKFFNKDYQLFMSR